MTHLNIVPVLCLVLFHFSSFTYGQNSFNNEMEGPEVTLTTGKVQGLMVVSAVNRVYFSFRGIRYAAPPVGHLRFKPPQPVQAWNGTVIAYRNPPGCAQPWRKQAFPEVFLEDCLYINVFTPYIKPPRDEPMAVMVWIHGGKHYQGSGSSFKYGPDFQLPENIVLVTFNYRLGVFGYLNLNTRSAAGNQSLKDMVAALRWVKREIHNFGGDPDRVTIVGGSSGGCDVHCLYISPMAQGLFHRAISHSFAACGVKYASEIVKDPGRKLAKLLGCPVSQSDPEETVHCLRTLTAQVLAERQIEVIPQLPGPSSIPFDPSVDSDFGDEVFMPTSPLEFADSFKSKVPYMMGLNSGEGLMDVEAPDTNPTQFENFEKNFYRYIPNDLRERANIKVIENITKRLKEFYFDNKPVTFDSVYRFSNYMMDARLTHRLVRVAKQISSHAPVYLWFFAFQGEFKQQHDIARYNLSGVNHGEELGYLFYRPSVIHQQTHMLKYPRECEMTTRMVKLWTNFAKYGNPTPNKYDSVLNVTWLPVNESTQHLVINDSLTMVFEDLFPERVKVWDDLWASLASPHRGEVYIGVFITIFLILLVMMSVMYLICRNSGRNKYTIF